MKDELLIKFLLNECRPEEQDNVRTWLALSAENEQYFRQFKRIWEESKKLDAGKEADVDAAWQRFKKRASLKRKKTVSIRMNPFLWRIAAVMVFAVGAWLWYTVSGPRSYIDLKSKAKVSSAFLPDGSELILNRHAHVRYARNFNDNRHLQLDSGEVFFEVTKDKSRPFTIQAGALTVEVVGTSFNVKYLKQQTEVIVESGIVKVRIGADEVTLQQGEKVKVRHNAIDLHKTRVDNHLYAYYRSGLFEADNTPLQELVDVLNEAYGVKIRLDHSAKALTISTTLRYERSIDENLLIISESLDNLKIKRNQNEIVLSY